MLLGTQYYVSIIILVQNRDGNLYVQLPWRHFSLLWRINMFDFDHILYLFSQVQTAIPEKRTCAEAMRRVQGT